MDSRAVDPAAGRYGFGGCAYSVGFNRARGMAPGVGLIIFSACSSYCNFSA